MIELIFILISLVTIVFTLVYLADKFTSFLLGEHKK